MYTSRDYPELDRLAQHYESDGLAVLGFPTAQFDNQEPGDGEEILRCLAHVRPGGNFAPAFPLMAKTEVNGLREHGLWTWLKKSCKLASAFNFGAISWTPIRAYDIGWNFEKFLIDRRGFPCRRYSADVPAGSLENDIAATLASGCPPLPPEACVTSGATRR